MNNEEIRDFKGIWIPKEVYLDERLSAIDKIVFSEIHSLSATQHGCFASNERLAKFCQCSVPTITRSIGKLKELGFIEVASFNGRRRVLESCVTVIRQTNQIDEADSSKRLGSYKYNNIYNNTINNTENNTKEKETKEKKKKSPVNYQEIVTLYNDTCLSLPKVSRLSEARKRAIKSVLNNYTTGDLQKAFEKVETSDWLTGRAKNGWKNANFDWIMKDANLTKILDGNYDNKNKSGMRYDWENL